MGWRDRRPQAPSGAKPRTRDHSELALRAFGAKITRALDVSIRTVTCAIDATVPGDFPRPHFSCVQRLSFPVPDAARSLASTLARAPDATALGAVIAVLNLKSFILSCGDGRFR